MRLIFLIVPLLLLSYLTHAQNNPKKIVIPSEWLGVKQGLSQGYVSAIIQDKEGLMWFATNDGLNKYDGYKVTVYRNNPKDSFSLPDNMISGIAEDENENFWVATRNKGMFLFDKKTERFYTVQLPHLKQGQGIHTIKFRDGKIFISTISNILLYEVNSKLKLNNPFTIKQIHILFDFQQLETGNFIGLNKTSLSQIFWMHDNSICLAGFDTTVQYHFINNYKNYSTNKYNSRDFGIPYNNKEIYYLIQNPKNENEIIAATQHLLTITNTATKKEIFQKRISGTSIWPIELDNGNILITCKDGLVYQLDLEKHQLFHCEFKDIDLKPVIVNNYVDANNVSWFGTNGYGVLVCDNKKNNFDTKDCRVYKKVFSTEDTPRIHRLPKPLQEETKQYFGLNNITEDKQGVYWIYAQTSSVSYYQLISYNPFTQKIKHFKPSDIVYDNCYIHSDKQNKLWLFSDYGFNNLFLEQLNKENGLVIRRYPIPVHNPSKEIEFVRHFYSDDHGILYLATGDGLYRFNPNATDSNCMWRKYQHVDKDSTSLVSNSLWCVCPDPVSPSNYLWIGSTGNGFSRLEIATGKCIHYSEKDGLPNNVVYGILTDSFNNLWLSTNKGLSCFNPSKKTFQNFVAEDGLQGDEFNHFDFMKLKTGELYFGGVNGYTIFKPEVVLQKQKEIPMAFTELSISNKVIDWKSNPETMNAPITYAKQIVLRPKQNMFTISFATLEYRSNKKKFYKYKLLGFLNEWTEPSIKNEATFSNLSPGTYTLLVTGTNTDGVWNSKGISTEIVVLPAWYQTWWLRMFIGLVIAFVLYAFYRYRLHQQTKLLTMRNRIAADLHDEIGSTLSSISIFSEAAKKVTDGNSTAIKVLNKISNNATQVMETMSDIVWAINSSNDKMDDLINRIRTYAIQLSESCNFKLHLPSNENIAQFKLDMYQRKHVFLLFKEAMNNIAKYAECANVWINIETVNQSFSLRIKDDGNGFDTRIKNTNVSLGGNGLINMKKRANDLHGELDIISKIGEGTEIVLTIKRHRKASFS